MVAYHFNSGCLIYSVHQFGGIGMSQKLTQPMLLFVLLPTLMVAHIAFMADTLLAATEAATELAVTEAETSTPTPKSRVSSQLQSAASGNLSKQQVSLLVKRFSGRPHKSFKDFCLSIYSSSRLTLTKSQREAVGNFAANEDLTGSQREIVFRILGIYAQLKYGGEALSALNDLVVIPTISSSSSSKGNFKRDKNFSTASALLKQKAKSFGLKFSNLGQSAYQVSFPWRKPKGSSLVIYTHIDVAPAERDKWRMDDGVAVSPFALTRMGTKFYGRGTRSNKNGIVAAMFAMRVIVDERIRLFNDIKLIIDTQGLLNEDKGDEVYLGQLKNCAGRIALNGVYPVGLSRATTELSSSFLSNALAEVAAESLEIHVDAGREQNKDRLEKPSLEPAKSSQQLEFGMLLPGQADLSREPLEYKELEEFLLDLQMVTEMIVRVGQMRRLN